MSNYIYENGELYHHGVKGMKWGTRKALKIARKDVKRAIKEGRTSNYDAELKRQRAKLRVLERDWNNAELEYHSSTWNPERSRKRNLAETAYVNGRRAATRCLQKMRLLDAGYTERSAEAGAKWLSENHKSLSIIMDTYGLDGRRR